MSYMPWQLKQRSNMDQQINDIGMGAAVSIVIVVLLLMFMFFYFRLLGKRVDEN